MCMLDEAGRATKKRHAINVWGHAHFFTFSCYRRSAWLLDDDIRAALVAALDNARKRHDLVLSAYVLMPEHVHVLLRPRSGAKVATILQAIKQPSARSALGLMRARGQSIQQFWQPGGGFDRNIWSDDAWENALTYIHLNPVRRGLVQRATDWRWSSAAFWAGERDVPLHMDFGK